MEISRMSICFLCTKQIEKSKYGSPHTFLEEIGERRNLTWAGDGEGYFEQDYQCSTCKSKFTLSSQKINLAWHLWSSGVAEE